MDSDISTSPPKKLKSPVQDGTINPKTSVICSKVPDSLFEVGAAEKHFNKFGKVQRIKLYRKRQMCLVEFDQPRAAELAVLNAGAYDGFLFDVTRRVRVRRKSKKDDDPDWVPDPDVEEELLAMSGVAPYSFTRQKSMDIDTVQKKRKPQMKPTKLHPVKRRTENLIRAKPIAGPASANVVLSAVEPAPVITSLNTTLSTSEAAAELHQLIFKVSLTSDEQWRILDARDKILRSWGGAGSRVKIGGATIGTCPDMCPEKELLHRQSEHQVMTLETVVDSDAVLEPWRAVKQYSRSSADQEMPMCYELRPAAVLMRTCAYLLHEIADTTRQVSLADWFHFMWDRFRSIRKDITQQAMCCAESIQLVEMCARFHAHCAARLADLEHTQFDQKLNTDNLTKCLQTLKHMYDDDDVGVEQKPNEAEFRGYIALLNLGDSNFLWEIKHLPNEIQKSEPIVFAIQVFIALDNNNYVRFFRLVKHRATYLQACILLRYFNDVRARALARIVKGFAPRGNSRYPALELMQTLSFESIESMKSFVNHYGLRLARISTDEVDVILNRNQFIEDSDPYPTARAISLIESKRQTTVGEVIAGGKLPKYNFSNCVLHTSFNSDGKLKVSSLIAEDLGYNTINDTNKDVKELKAEVHKLLVGGNIFISKDKKQEVKRNTFTTSGQALNLETTNETLQNEVFLFQPAIPIVPKNALDTYDKVLEIDTKKMFTFSNPDQSPEKEAENIFKLRSSSGQGSKSIFGNVSSEPFNTSSNLVKPHNDVFKKSNFKNSLFSQKTSANNFDKAGMMENKNIFSSSSTNLFSKKDEIQRIPSIFKADVQAENNVFSKSTDTQNNTNNTNPSNFFGTSAIAQDNTTNPTNLFGQSSVSKENFTKSSNIFGKSITSKEVTKPSSIFGAFGKPSTTEKPSLFQINNTAQPGIVANGDGVFTKTSPAHLFKSALQPTESETKNYLIFQSKNKPTVANSIFNSVNALKTKDVYDFDQNINEDESDVKLHEINDQKREQEVRQEVEKNILQEEERWLEERRKEAERHKEQLKRKADDQRREEERQKEEELRREDERLKEIERLKIIEEKKQQQLKEKLEKERQAELQRNAEEKRFKKIVERESIEFLNELVRETEDETVKEVMEEERDIYKKLVHYADSITEDIFSEVCNEMCHLEIKAELFLSKKLMTKWFSAWKRQVSLNLKRRKLLENTPVWLTENTPTEEACILRRPVEKAALQNMNAIHRGYRFNGELKLLPSPERYNIMEIIRSPLLKRAKQINYPIDNCFFWKLTLISPGTDKWLCRRIHLEKWLRDAFSDKKPHESNPCLIHVGKQSWNHLIDFGISVSLINADEKANFSEALEGTNSLLLYLTEEKINSVIDEIVKQLYTYQVIPVAIITSIAQKDLADIELQLVKMKNKKNISDYRIYYIDGNNIINSLDTNSKRALKWLAKNFNKPPPIEIDCLKSICQRYLGNEIWSKLKSVKDSRMYSIHKDLNKLIECYNISLEMLTKVITNEDLFNYQSFPLEFKEYLDSTFPFPKSYEYIPSSVKNMENVAAVKDIMTQLKLPNSILEFQPINAVSMKEHVRKYCKQIGWSENTGKVTCQVVALLPGTGTNLEIQSQDLSIFNEPCDLVDLLNILVYEKISNLKNFENRFAIYEKSAIEDYRNSQWIFETNVLKSLKHKALQYTDEIDLYISAKRRKIEIDSQECLMLEDTDVSLVEENIQVAEEGISMFNNYKEVVQQLEQKLDEERKKSDELENLLKAAICNV